VSTTSKEESIIGLNNDAAPEANRYLGEILRISGTEIACAIDANDQIFVLDIFLADGTVA